MAADAGTRQEPGPLAGPGSVPDAMGAASLPSIDIDAALHNGWLELWYQPKVDLKRKCLAGAEALARFRHPDLGVLMPGNFRPEVVADSICRLTEQMLIAALEDWTMFAEAGFNLHFAINIPGPVLLKLRIATLVDEHRPNYDAWPGLIVEVTEEEIVRDLRLAQEIAARLRASGIEMAIDDFGAGYSSFASLRALPFVELKLHESFVRDCATDVTNAAICQTAIDLAHRLGSAAVAGAIGSAADLQALMAMGCDFGQGAMIAPSMPREHLLDLLVDRCQKADVRGQMSDARAQIETRSSSVL
jgi:EAL domain-containing protein (putative c-di-GMP-specific phosphodiesterase class I)